MSRADFNLPPVNGSAVVDGSNKKPNENYVKISLEDYDNLKERLRKSEAEVSRLTNILDRINLPLNDVRFQPVNVKVNKYTDGLHFAERYVVTFEVKIDNTFGAHPPTPPTRNNFRGTTGGITY